MALQIEQTLPTVAALEERYPVSERLHQVGRHRKEIEAVLSGQDKRLLAVIGPCSASPSEAVRTYADRLSGLNEQIKDRVLIVMRAYIQKPRTTIGWPGPLNQPDPLGEPDIAAGMWECRKLMWHVGQQHPLADEMLFTQGAPAFEPLMSYVALGARSAEDPEHRFVASGFDCPVGVKNGTTGDLQVGVNGILCVQSPHVFAMGNNQVRSTGNPYAHLILRGGGSSRDEKKTNYDEESLQRATGMLMTTPGINNHAIIVDASHDNSLVQNGSGMKKDPLQQINVIADVLKGLTDERDAYRFMRGFMAEGFLIRGNQKISPDMRRDGLSITDPCLGWEESAQLLRMIADARDKNW